MPHFLHPFPEKQANLTRRFPVRHRRVCGPLALVPLLNVVLLAWLFYVVNSAFVLQPGIVMDLPSAPFAEGARFGTLVVTLTQEGMIFLNDERVPLDQLPDVLKKAVPDPSSSALLIEADGRVRHRALVDIYNMAADAGFREVTLATRLPGKAGPEP